MWCVVVWGEEVVGELCVVVGLWVSGFAAFCVVFGVGPLRQRDPEKYMTTAETIETIVIEASTRRKIKPGVDS